MRTWALPTQDAHDDLPATSQAPTPHRNFGWRTFRALHDNNHQREGASEHAAQHRGRAEQRIDTWPDLPGGGQHLLQDKAKQRPKRTPDLRSTGPGARQRHVTYLLRVYNTQVSCGTITIEAYDNL